MLTVIPIRFRAANQYVAMWHRHHRPAAGCLFCIAVMDETQAIRGVGIVARPVARLLDDGKTCEVVRVATDGCANACSAIYGAARRAARALGYRRIITYTLVSESGVSLRASGWQCAGPAGGGGWDRPNRHRLDRAPTEKKTRWEAHL